MKKINLKTVTNGLTLGLAMWGAVSIAYLGFAQFTPEHKLVLHSVAKAECDARYDELAQLADYNMKNLSQSMGVYVRNLRTHIQVLMHRNSVLFRDINTYLKALDACTKEVKKQETSMSRMKEAVESRAWFQFPEEGNVYSCRFHGVYAV